MAFGKHLSAILGKEWLYWKRNICRSICEICIPFVLMIILMILRITITTKTSPAGPNYYEEIVGIDPTDDMFIMNDIPNMGRQYYQGFFSKNSQYAIGIAPNDTEIVKEMLNYFSEREMMVFGFKNEKELTDYAAKPSYRNSKNKLLNVTTGLVFTKTGKDKEYAYKLLLDKDAIPDIAENFVDPLQKAPQEGELMEIFRSGAFYLKTIADNLILKKESKNNDAQISYAYVPMMYKEYEDDLFGMLTDFLLGYFFLLSVLLPLITLIGKFMNDKISRMRESMKLMGINDSTYFISYFLFYAILQFLVSFGCAAIIKNTLFPKSNYLILAIFFFLFGIAIYPVAIIIWYFSNEYIAK